MHRSTPVHTHKFSPRVTRTMATKAKALSEYEYTLNDASSPSTSQPPSHVQSPPMQPSVEPQVALPPPSSTDDSAADADTPPTGGQCRLRLPHTFVGAINEADLFTSVANYNSVPSVSAVQSLCLPPSAASSVLSVGSAQSSCLPPAAFSAINLPVQFTAVSVAGPVPSASNAQPPRLPTAAFSAIGLPIHSAATSVIGPMPPTSDKCIQPSVAHQTPPIRMTAAEMDA